MLKTKEERKTIFRSLIASGIFLFCLKPILELIWKLISTTSSSTYSRFVDDLYSNAALEQRDWIAFLIFGFLLLLICIGVISTFFMANLKFKSLELDYRLNTAKSEKEKKKLIEEEVDENKTQMKLERLFKCIGYCLVSNMYLHLY